ncbi:hypothetical protein V5799_031492 [Amblyomma americanum]|uniref:Protein sleepless n=1 Tax=Amblyomma americanum TaxID=6943 RepID=A0AAQ4EK39_AMBAM
MALLLNNVERDVFPVVDENGVHAAGEQGGLLYDTEGRTSYCFVCRSRGQLGDCRDPFPYNETTVEGVRGVEASPCASKWCGKLVEGRDDDFDLATERMCLQRPPDDLEERCAETLYQNRRVYMCFCRGDVCNGAHRTTAMGSAAVGLTLTATLFIRYMWQVNL